MRLEAHLSEKFITKISRKTKTPPHKYHQAHHNKTSKLLEFMVRFDDYLELGILSPDNRESILCLTPRDIRMFQKSIKNENIDPGPRSLRLKCTKFRSLSICVCYLERRHSGLLRNINLYSSPSRFEEDRAKNRTRSSAVVSRSE